MSEVLITSLKVEQLGYLNFSEFDGKGSKHDAEPSSLFSHRQPSFARPETGRIVHKRIVADPQRY